VRRCGGEGVANLAFDLKIEKPRGKMGKKKTPPPPPPPKKKKNLMHQEV